LEEILQMGEVQLYLTENLSQSVPKIPDTTSQQHKFDIVILTALHDTEFEALKNLPIDFTIYNADNDDTKYLRGKIGSQNILIATDDRMGIAAATGLSMKLIFKIFTKISDNGRNTRRRQG
jgi:hypothetical protein